MKVAEKGRVYVTERTFRDHAASRVHQYAIANLQVGDAASDAPQNLETSNPLSPSEKSGASDLSRTCATFFEHLQHVVPRTLASHDGEPVADGKIAGRIGSRQPRFSNDFCRADALVFQGDPATRAWKD